MGEIEESQVTSISSFQGRGSGPVVFQADCKPSNQPAGTGIPINTHFRRTPSDSPD